MARVAGRKEAGSFTLERLVGVAMVASMHVAAGVMLYEYQMLPAPVQAQTVFVNFITLPAQEIPPSPQPAQLRPQPQRKKPAVRPPTMLAAQLPVEAPTETLTELAVSSPQPSMLEAPVVTQQAVAEPGLVEAVPATPPSPPEPLVLNTDLAVGCPHRFPPEYPTGSRRFGESGKLVLRVELDTAGRIAAVRVKQSTGFRRLDEAGIAAVRQWQCDPPMRDGKAVAAVALQPFNFVHEGRQ